MKIKVGVIFGGPTVEHEISIISAVQAMGFMDPSKYEIVPIYITKERDWYTGKMLSDMEVYQNFDDLKRYAKKVTLVRKDGSFYLQTMGMWKRNVAEIDIAFPIVHGNNVEDGTLSGYLETLGIPYVGSGVLGSALGQDKVVMKQVLGAAGLPIVDYRWFYDSEFLNTTDAILKSIEKMGYPVIVKPATLGSSVGINYVKDKKDIYEVIEEAMKYDHKIIVEKAVENLVEVNCSVLGNYEYQELSEIEEVMTTEEFLTYQDKYIGNGKGKMGGNKGMVATDRVIPARISDDLKNKVKEVSLATFRALNLSNVCRIDFLIDQKAKKVFVNESNTVPGSLSFYLWEPIGVPYEKLLDRMITIAIKDFKNNQKKVSTFETNVLSNFSGVKGTKGLKGTKGKLR